MPGPWGTPPIMYPPCPSWMGWYGPWASPLMHFHPEWSRATMSFVHEDYYTGDSCYGSVDHQQDRRGPRQENRTVWNVKLDHPVSSKTATAPGQQHKQWMPKDGSSTDGSGSSQGQTGMRSQTSANDEVEHNTKKGLEGFWGAEQGPS
jgi:hypothetical protein